MEEIELKVENVETEKITNSLVAQEAGEITEEKVESSLNYDTLDEKEKAAIDKFLAKIDISNTAQILQFGASTQTNISKFSDTILAEVKTKDTGKVGDLLSDLVSEIKDFQTDSSNIINSKPSFFNSVKKQVNKMVAKYNKVENNIGAIEKTLEAQKLTMLKDIAVFDTMYEKNLEYFKEISLYIIAGEKKLEELRTQVLPALEAKARETSDQLDVQAVKDMADTMKRFEKKIYDLKTTRIISIQMAPQIRLIQNNDSELVNKIQSSIINTIPLWKNQVVIALGLANSKAALETQRKVSNLTNDMLKANSELLKQGTIEIAQESERAIVDVETLSKTNADIIETLDTVLQIHTEGKRKRQEAEIELAKIESELKNKLLEVKLEAES